MPRGGLLKAKKITALFAAIAVAISLAGCSLSREVASLDPYSPSDGVMLDSGDLKLRNVLFVVDEDGNAVLIGSLVNGSDWQISGTLETMSSDGQVVVTEFSVAGGEKYDIGYNGTEPTELYLEAMPGSMHSVYVRVSGNDPVELPTPVMDGSLAEYRDFID